MTSEQVSKIKTISLIIPIAAEYSITVSVVVQERHFGVRRKKLCESCLTKWLLYVSFLLLISQPALMSEDSTQDQRCHTQPRCCCCCNTQTFTSPCSVTTTIYNFFAVLQFNHHPLITMPLKKFLQFLFTITKYLYYNIDYSANHLCCFLSLLFSISFCYSATS